VSTQKPASLIKRSDCLSLPSSWIQPWVQAQPTGRNIRATTHRLKDTQIKSAHQYWQLPRKSAHITPSQSLNFILKVWLNQQCAISDSCLASALALQPKCFTAVLLSTPSIELKQSE